MIPHRPAADWELARIVIDANIHGDPIEVIGSGSRRAYGRPLPPMQQVTTAAMRAMPLYEPTELVMSAQAGALTVDIERELARNGQMLAFEPIDLGPLLGVDTQNASIGGMFSGNLSGSRRIQGGAARDHLLGIKGVTGSGEIFKNGGRVMKNVTGVDLVRATAGSWGTLAILTELTFKVLPSPDETQTLLLAGLNEDIAIEALTTAMATPYEVSGAAHIDGNLTRRLNVAPGNVAGRSLTAIRLENFASFVTYRVQALADLLKQFGEILVIDNDASHAFWDELRRLTMLSNSPKPVWRLSVAPSKAPLVVSGIRRYLEADAYYDGAGGVIWLEVPQSADAGASDIRRVLASHGGHATLVRAEPDVRAAVDVFQPMELGIERLTRGLKQTFDPRAILNPGRMYAGI